MHPLEENTETREEDHENKIPELIFIVPYRDRVQEKQHFEIYMRYILEDIDKNSYKIFFAHQCDKRPFNRGATKNIGFLAMKNLYPNDYKNITFIFNDIDTIPYKKSLLNFHTSKGIVKHFYGFRFALGGIFSITGEDFEKINGFPGFWGWGLEDNIINDRCINHKLMIDRSNFYNLGAVEIIHIKDTPQRLIADRKNSKEFIEDGLNKIYNLKYSINDELININSFDNSIILNNQKFYVKDLKKTGNFIPYDYINTIKNLRNPKKNNGRLGMKFM